MKLYYFTDPMCSWCYGFSPTIKQLKENYPDIDLQIISGGFAPGGTQAVDDNYKEFLECHWRNVHRMSGQPFDHSMKFVSANFRYDTEPSSRALAVVQELQPEKDFDYLVKMQQSFYVEGKDIVNPDVLATLATEIGIDKKTFLSLFQADAIKRKTQQGFEFSRQLGVQGFPTLLTIDNGSVKVLTRGFQTFQQLQPLIDAQLKTTTVAENAQGQTCSAGQCDC